MVYNIVDFPYHPEDPQLSCTLRQARVTIPVVDS